MSAKKTIGVFTSNKNGKIDIQNCESIQFKYKK